MIPMLTCPFVAAQIFVFSSKSHILQLLTLLLCALAKAAFLALLILCIDTALFLKSPSPGAKSPIS